LNWISFGIFTVFGAVSIRTAAELTLGAGAAPWGAMGVALVLFGGLCLYGWRKKAHQSEET
jgi:FtsH-binding integral membrane protein